MLKIEHFLYIIEVSKSGSINRAAENLYISQPYLSTALKELESELGVKLFKRSYKGVSLTPSGEKFLQYSVEVQEIIEKVQRLKKGDTAPGQRLIVSSIYSFTMLDFYYDFLRNHTGINRDLSYEEVPNKSIPNKVCNRQTDVGIIYFESNQKRLKVKKLKEIGIRFEELCKEPLHIIVNHHHPLAQNEYVELKDLEKYPLIIEKHKNDFKEGVTDNNPFPEFFMNIKKESIHFDNNRSLMYYLTKKDDCFSVGQKCLNITNPFVKTKQLKYIPINGLDSDLIIGYIIRDDLEMNELIESFIYELKEFFESVKQSV